MLAEVLAALAPRDGGVYVDGTFGAGGYTRAILEFAETRVYAIDRDPRAIADGAALLAAFPRRLTLIEGRFSDMEALLAAHGVTRVNGIAFDIGVSSMQIDDPSRGFSFAKDGPLDMRMGSDGQPASDIVNTFAPERLTRIIGVLGEEKRAKAIARAIVEARREGPILTTRELAAIIAGVFGGRPRRIHPATRSFQALRIYVNRELEELALALGAAERLLAPGGRLAVVTFHSLEDRIVKRFMHEGAGKVSAPSRHAPIAIERSAPQFDLLFAGHREPSDAEIEMNPRARSAKLRAAIRTTAPPRLVDPESLGVPSS
jgi:16S rRNA (cytosine1402-N4)-methyltransferase